MKAKTHICAVCDLEFDWYPYWIADIPTCNKVCQKALRMAINEKYAKKKTEPNATNHESDKEGADAAKD